MAEILAAGLDAGRTALQRFLAGDQSLRDTNAVIIRLAVETIPNCDAATMTTLLRGRPSTTAFTAERALALDETQYRHDGGPCLSAIRIRGPEHVSIADETRWQPFLAAAREDGVAGVLSLPLGNEEEVVGSLNLYSYSHPRYPDDAVDAASAFADQLGIAAAALTTYVDAFELAQQLQQALESRAVIEQAKGILMAAERCDPQRAFDILVRASQNRNRKVRDIAADIVARYTRADGSG